MFDFNCKNIVLLLASVMLFGACSGTDAEAPLDSKNESFMAAYSGKSDSPFNIQEGSDKAKVIIDFLNDATYDELDIEVGLDRRAAGHITNYTRDNTIESLEELDEIGWVGDRAFKKIVKYLKRKGIFGGNEPNEETNDGEITPGADEDKGRVKLVIPSTQKPVVPFQVTVTEGEPEIGDPRAYNLVPGQVSNRMNPGELYFRIEYTELSGVEEPHGVQSFTTELDAGETKTIQLGLVTTKYRQYSQGQNTAQPLSDFGPTPEKWIKPPYVLFSFNNESEEDKLEPTKHNKPTLKAFNGKAEAWAPFLPKTELMFRTQDQQNDEKVYDEGTLDVEPGDKHVLDIKRPPGQDFNFPDPAKVKINQPEDRALPTARLKTESTGSDYWCANTKPARNMMMITHDRGETRGGFLSLRGWDDPEDYCFTATPYYAGAVPMPAKEEIYVEKALNMPETGTKTLTIYPFNTINGSPGTFTRAEDLDYVYLYNRLTGGKSIELESGETKVIDVERIDVHDIQVTDEHGNTTSAEGVYRVYRQEAGEWKPLGFPNSGQPYAFPTGTGIDVPPGTYKVDTECLYRDCENADTFKINLD